MYFYRKYFVRLLYFLPFKGHIAKPLGFQIDPNLVCCLNSALCMLNTYQKILNTSLNDFIVVDLLFP